MEYLEKILKKTGWNSLLSSVIFAILGIILIMNPEGTIKVVSYILGIMFILVGIYKIATYFVGKGKYDLFSNDIVYGIIAVILGIVTIVYSNTIGSIFRILIGIWIIYSGILRMSLSLKLKNINSKAWIYSLIISLVIVICGLYILFTSNAIIVTIGAIMLVYSILDIVEDIFFIKNVNKLM